MYSEVADVLVTSDCLSQDMDEKLVSFVNNLFRLPYEINEQKVIKRISPRQARAAALKAQDKQQTFNYKEWACSNGGPEAWEDNASPLTSRINTGVTFFRSTMGGMAMAKHWIKSLVVRKATNHSI